MCTLAYQLTNLFLSVFIVNGKYLLCHIMRTLCGCMFSLHGKCSPSRDVVGKKMSDSVSGLGMHRGTKDLHGT